MHKGKINGNGAKAVRLGNVSALVRVVRQLEPDVPAGGAQTVAARRRMVAAFFRMLDQRGVVQANVLPVDGGASGCDSRIAALPPRLKQILQCLLHGDGEKQIARKLKLSPHTVHYYVKDLHKRFEVSSRAELLARFISPSTFAAG